LIATKRSFVAACNVVDEQ